MGLHERGTHVGKSRRVEHPGQAAADERVGAALARRLGVKFTVAIEGIAVRIAEMAAEIDVLDNDRAARRERFHRPEQQSLRHGQMRHHEADIDERGSPRRPLFHHAALVELDMADIAAFCFVARRRELGLVEIETDHPATRPDALGQLETDVAAAAARVDHRQPGKRLETIEQSFRGRRQNSRQHRKARTAFFSALDDVAAQLLGLRHGCSLRPPLRRT